MRWERFLFWDKINRIYGRRDYLTRNRARHLYAMNLVIFFVSIAACLVYIRQGLRVGFLIFGISALISIALMFFNKLETAVKTILYLSLVALTFGLFFGMQNGNIYFSMATILVLFLHFSDIKRTILVSAYTGILMSYRLYLYSENGEISSAFVFDTIFKFILFCTIAIITVRVLNSHNKEKEIFIREIHHRVKNNLQILSGFAILQRDSGGLRETGRINDFSDRILMLSRVHDAIYKMETDYEVDLNAILREIVNLSSRVGSKERIRLITGETTSPLNIEISVPFAMIAYELLNNAILHGSFESDDIPILVELKFTEGKYVFSVSGPGPAIETDSVWSDPKTTGFTLVCVMTKQLKGNFRIESEKQGIRAVVEFSNQVEFATFLG
ncbi:sensor histidine kinase [Leptospira gomenensis]|uniref:histidine kinase n=1 Tax=Leptospira gomenensis TaxID=2484974 RepID=A0A5F1YZN0_9LEPT|nr:sensor histidine kinase [Leptospira gomenensis]TGK29447.1 sensor histidine kinase [Leptospira gomenensis]TGK33650.1 sensor histidine kinase [Leptospira gomenensis]TGK44891.1 sensor histidine kinase [Leptospira gomenensis]TGK64512.1 sensor histidine kinase [Leptospira gomenensis]